MNCPNCGRKKGVTTRDLILGLMVDAGARTNHKFEFCDCSVGVKQPVFIKMNEVSEEQAINEGGLFYKTWVCHHAPDMGDCRYLDYGYNIVGGKVICEAGDKFYVDITDSIEESFPRYEELRQVEQNNQAGS